MLFELEIGVSLLLLGGLLASLPWLSRDDLRVRSLIYVVLMVLLGRYVIWRGAITLPPLSWTLGPLVAYAYFAFEWWSTLHAVRMFKMYRRFTDRTPEVEAHLSWYSGRAPPLVDLLIPTYNEDEAVLERAIVGALGQTHPRVRVWILDDGRRAWLRDLAAARGVHYLVRPDNAGFKAGNLNHALSHIAGLAEPSEFVAVLDCDFIAKPEFVRRSLALMHDERVAIVQTKQVYYNLDPLQFALPGGRFLPDWQRFAFDFIAPCRDVFYGQTCCGTCFLARRSSLESIGGIPTESVAEDALLTFALNERGLRTVYLAEALSFGIVAEGLREFLTQCGRWCLGRVQNVHSKWGAGSPHKPLLERYRFVEGNVLWAVFTLAKLFQVWLPISYWFVGGALFPIQGTNDGFLAYFGPLWLFNAVVTAWLSRGAVLPIIADARQLLWAPVVLKATYRGLSKSKDYRFDVTDKGALRDRMTIHWRPLRWLILVGGLTIAGLAYRAFELGPASIDSSYDAFAYFWSYYNLLCISTAAAVCFEPPQRRGQERFPTTESASLSVAEQARSVALVDISVSGALIEAQHVPAIGSQVLLGVEAVGSIPATVVRASERHFAVALQADAEQRARLIRKLFSDRYVRPIISGRPLLVLRGVLTKAFV